MNKKHDLDVVNLIALKLPF